MFFRLTTNHRNPLAVAGLHQDFSLGVSIDRWGIVENQGGGFSQALFDPLCAVQRNVKRRDTL
jgi:hypothetical protein